MHVYRFIVKFEDMIDFSREVDVLADQTFGDIYKLLSENLKLEKNQLASFFICDHNYRKKIEIPLAEAFDDLRKKKSLDEDEEEEYVEPVKMHEAALNEFIDDPHQKMLMEYDAVNRWSLYFEMIKIYPSDKQSEYPKIVKSEGEAPRELQAVKIPKAPESEESKEEEENNVEEDGADERIDDSAFYNEQEIDKMKADDVTADGGFEIEKDEGEEFPAGDFTDEQDEN
ncbi:MAG: hypothetical protein R6U11_10820 [Bacteroidales bacterium]